MKRSGERKKRNVKGEKEINVQRDQERSEKREKRSGEREERSVKRRREV